MRSIYLTTWIVGTFCLLVSCTTAPLKRFESIKVGMYKDEVLDTLGSPQESRFKNEEHIWNYRFVTESGPVAKEIRLKKDFVTFVGDPTAPSGDKFARVKVGMTKSEVLDLVGFPIRAETKGSVDVWNYSLADKSKGSMAVEFDKDKAAYVGPSKEKQIEGADGVVPIEN
jgi:outer membrane protein assembly factor BamE (lipoprotein component of BamABCDE complex)